MATDQPAAADSKPTHLEPSKLGTKEYWDSLYISEISNHADDPDDTGTNWFDDSDAQDKVLEFLANLPDLHDAQSTTSFLDLGTGNGALLFGLRYEGWKGRMLGVDYSARSVEFARRIAGTRREEGVAADVDFQLHDIINTDPSVLLTGAQTQGWDVVLDKGTFDAISLSAEADASGRRIVEGYRPQVLRLVKEGGLFLVTSCNWTEEELVRWFEGVRDGDEVGFGKVGRVEYRTFSFGGIKGQTISSLCFRKVRKSQC